MSKPTTVVRMQRNNKGNKIIQDCDLYIGRENMKGGWKLPASDWQNPFKMSDHNENREKVI